MKTLYNLAVGDVVVKDGEEHTVLEVLTQSCLLSSSGEIEVAANWNTFKELEDRGYTVKPKTKKKWAPKMSTGYYCPDVADSDKYLYSIWENDSYDNHRLAYNLVFQTKEEAIARTEEILEKIK
jgi:hypothetical protein